MRRIRSVIVLLLVLIGAGFPLPDVGLAQGTVYTDTMDSAETGLLSTETFDPTISFTYQNSQFVVDVQQPSFRGDITSILNLPEMASSRLTVDAFIEGDPANKYVIAGCRRTDAGEGYYFGYLPATGEIIIWRRDSTGDTNIAQSVDPSLIAPANTMYQIGIDCWTGIITGIVNGQPVASAFDATHAVGLPFIGLGANGQETDGLKVAFDNLTVTDNGNLELGPETPVWEPTAVGATTGQSTPMRDPAVDAAGALSDAFTVSLESAPVVSGLGGDADVDLDGLAKLPAGVQLADFYAEIYYTTPALPAGTTYLVGYCFWTDSAGNCYDIYLQDHGNGTATWGYGYDSASGDYQQLQSGELPAGSVDPTPGATNFLGLTVYQGTAILSGNTYDVGAVIPLDGTPIAGDVQSEIGFLDSGNVGVADPLAMSTSDFAVWDLSSGMVPVAEDAVAVATEPPVDTAVPTTAPITTSAPIVPPLQGTDSVAASFDQARAAAMLHPPLGGEYADTISQDPAGYMWVTAGINVSDFYTIVTLTNPTDLTTPSDIGIGFRDDRDSEGGVRFVIDSTGTWYMLILGQDPYATGAATGFDIAPGASNTIELLVQGGTGTIAINGVLLPQFDLSTITNRGDIYIGTGFFQGDSVAGRAVLYSNWWIFPTDILDVPSG